jgi:hypothetical protein
MEATGVSAPGRVRGAGSRPCMCVRVAREYVLAFVSSGKVGAGRKVWMAKLQPVGDGRP